MKNNFFNNQAVTHYIKWFLVGIAMGLINFIPLVLTYVFDCIPTILLCLK